MNVSPRAQAQIDYKGGEGHNANPYPQGSPERDAYMMEMARLQQAEFNALLQQDKAGK